jgi:sugar phosphate permease
VVAIFAIAAIAAKPTIGFVCDRFFGGSRKVPTIVLFALFGAILVVFGQLSGTTAFIIAAPFLGIAAYGWSPLIVSLVPRLVPGTVAATASGLANGLWQLGSVFSPLAVGAAFGATHSFDAAFLALAAGPILGVAVMIFVRERTAKTTTTGQATEE